MSRRQLPGHWRGGQLRDAPIEANEATTAWWNCDNYPSVEVNGSAQSITRGFHGRSNLSTVHRGGRVNRE